MSNCNKYLHRDPHMEGEKKKGKGRKNGITLFEHEEVSEQVYKGICICQDSKEV